MEGNVRTCAAHHSWSAGQQHLTMGLDCQERLGPVERVCPYSAREIYFFSPGSISSWMTLLLWMEILQGLGWELGYAGTRLMCIRDRGKIRGISASLVTNSAKLLTAGDVHVCGWHMRARENMKTKLSNGFAVGLTIKRTLTSDSWLLADVWLTQARTYSHTRTHAHATY